MEQTARAARERLSELTSREGDWFMDELCTMSGNVSQMTKLLEFCFSVSTNRQSNKLIDDKHNSKFESVS